MIVWRLCRAPFIALDGEGARRSGNRWNSPGRTVIYAASTLSLAVLELLVHTDPDLVPDDMVAMRLEVPEAEYPSVSPGELPKPESMEWYRERGDAWLGSKQSLVLFVPSVIVPVEQNVLINPAHPDMSRVRVRDISPFQFDTRLL